jgi:hypothetical protein
MRAPPEYRAMRMKMEVVANRCTGNPSSDMTVPFVEEGYDVASE